MTISSNDLTLVYSGGSSNNDASRSIGGNPSSVPIVGLMNNLFDDIDNDQRVAGKIDYRAIYLFNNSVEDWLYQTKIFIDSQVPLGTLVELGVKNNTDVQRITISGPITGGTFTLGYQGDFAVIPWTSSILNLALAVKNGLLLNTILSGVQVTASQLSESVELFVSFEGADNNKFHDLLTIDATNLVGETFAGVVRTANGSPINSIAPKLDSSEHIPFGVTFSIATVDSPIVLGSLGPGDGVPIWIKRITPINTDTVLEDGFSLKIAGSPFAE